MTQNEFWDGSTSQQIYTESSVDAGPYYFGQVSEFALTWVSDHIAYVREQFEATDSPSRDYVLAELKEIENEIPRMKYAWED